MTLSSTVGSRLCEGEAVRGGSLKTNVDTSSLERVAKCAEAPRAQTRVVERDTLGTLPSTEQ